MNRPRIREQLRMRVASARELVDIDDDMSREARAIFELADCVSLLCDLLEEMDNEE